MLLLVSSFLLNAREYRCQISSGTRLGGYVVLCKKQKKSKKPHNLENFPCTFTFGKQQNLKSIIPETLETETNTCGRNTENLTQKSFESIIEALIKG